MDGSVELLLPPTGPVGLDGLDAALRGLGEVEPLAPFDPVAIAILGRLHSALVTDEAARLYPELQAFAFWIRPKAIERMAERHRARADGSFRLVPKGVVFHLPPGNVALLFAYCWSLSLLAGNRNIVRLSARKGVQTDILLRLIGDSLELAAGRAGGQIFLTYGHDDEVTAKLSAACDLRMVWGGDAAVAEIGKIALPPLAGELRFPDRFSYAAFDAETVANEGAGLDELVERFYGDVYWFDQMACSSPKMVIWVGSPEACETAARAFYAALSHEAVRRGYPLDAGLLCSKLDHAYTALAEGMATRLSWYGGRLAVLGCDTFPQVRGKSFGGGILYDFRIGRLADLAPYVMRKDQTLVHHGFDPSEIEAFAATLAGRGLDRLVPAGQALAFDDVWDGHDLMSAFSRRVGVLCSP